MGIIKGHKAHALAMHDGNSSQHPKSKLKGKGKVQEASKKEGNSKPFDDSSGSKGGKGKKGKSKCGYCNRGNHPESSCMKKTIDLMAKVLQQNNLGDYIPENAKKKPEDKPPERRGNSHALIAINSSPDAWILDSGASYHMAATKNVLSSITACTGPPILMGDDTPVEVTGQGRVELQHGSFENVLHIPKLSVNLLSIYQITHSGTGKRVEFTPDSATIYDMHDNSKISIGEANDQSRLYTFSKFIAKSDSALLLTHADDDSRIWHERFGHLNFKYMQQLCKQGMVKGLPNIHFSKGVCQGCVIGKHPQEKFEKGKAWRASSPLELIHSDLMGPFPNPSISKARYVLTFIDDFSRYTWVYFLMQKSEVFENLKDFKALVENQSGRKIKILRTDNGGEYVNKYVQHLCSQSGIQLQHIVPYSLQHNRVAEQKNISLKEMATCMLHARPLPSKLWVEALNCANYI